MITFTVHGIPVPQGSMKGFVRGNRAFLTSANSKMKPWRQEVAAIALACRPSELWDGPLRMNLEFRFLRPKTVSEKKRPLPCVKPDVDKLERAIFDALRGVIYVDDAQICDGWRRKIYSDSPGVTVIIERMDGVLL